MEYLKIKPIEFGELKEKKANAIAWQVNGLVRGAKTATAFCGLVLIKGNGTEESGMQFTVNIPEDVLLSWNKDDSVIDKIVLAYSPLFEAI